MAANRIFLGIVCTSLVGWVGVHSGGGLSPSLAKAISPQRGERSRVLSIAKAEVGVKELTGTNDGRRIAEYLSYTGINVRAPYCAAYISWCFGKAGYKQPNTAWSPAMFPVARIVKEPKPADLLGLYYPSLKRIGHVGFVELTRGDFLQTLEANTNLEGSREGQGVYRRMRHKRTVSKYADWISK